MAKKSKEEQQGRIIPLEDFILSSVKINKGKNVQVKYHIETLNSRVHNQDCPEKWHPDLENALKELEPYMADILGFTEGWDFARANNGQDMDFAEKAKKGYDDCVSRMKVNGITFKGDPNSDKYGVSITGSFKNSKGSSVGIAVPKVTFESDTYGYEEDIDKICDKITEEVYNYVFLKKKEQTDIEDQAEGFDNNGGAQLSIVDDEEEAF